MLTEAQIQTLDELCREKGVRYYDLRQEIVDHLATEIEQQMENTPGVDFRSLVAITFETFGEKGLQAIVEAKEASIQEAYQQCHRRYFWSFFTPPKIVLTFLIAVCLFLPFIYAGEKVVLQIHRIYFSFTAAICLLTVSGILLQPGKTHMPLLLLKGVKRKSLNRNIGLLVVLMLNAYNALKKDFVRQHMLKGDSYGAFSTFAMFVLIFVTITYTLIFIARYHAVLKMYAKAKREYPLAFMKKFS